MISLQSGYNRLHPCEGKGKVEVEAEIESKSTSKSKAADKSVRPTHLFRIAVVVRVAGAA
jgi:hypothetical protein